MTARALYCCGCSQDVQARLTDGREIYPHRPDLADLPFWRCPACRNYVGCHHKTKDRTRPLGCIPDASMKNARQHIHRLLDPVWQGKHLSRGHCYARLSEVLGREYHTGELRTLEEARVVYRAVQEIVRSVAT